MTTDKPPLPQPTGALVSGGEVDLDQEFEYALYRTICKTAIVNDGYKIPDYVTPGVRAKWPQQSVAFWVWCDAQKTPDKAASMLTAAINAADDYAWVYSEKFQFFDNAPQEWIDAITRGKAAAKHNIKLLVEDSYGDYPRPTPDWAAKNLSNYQHLPFDGLVVTIGKTGDYYGDTLGHELFKPKPICYGQFIKALHPLCGADVGRYKTKLVRVWLCNCQDLFAESYWLIALENLRNLSRALYDLGYDGIFLDTEEYGTGCYKFPLAGHSLDACLQMAIERGYEVSQTIYAEFPKCVLMPTVPPCYSLSGNNANSVNYELYGAFYCGMLKGWK